MLRLQGHEGTAHCLTFAHEGGTLISGGRDGRVRTWDLTGGGQSSILATHQSPVISLALHPRGRAFASGSIDQEFILSDTVERRAIQTFGNQMAAVTGLAWLAGPSTLAVACGERMRPERAGELRYYAFEGKNPPSKTAFLEARGIWSLAANPSGTVIAWAGGDRAVQVLDITRQRPRTFRQPSPALAVALSPDGSLAASSCDRLVKLWDVPTGHERATLEGHLGMVRAIAFSPDGSTLATGGQDKTVRLWRTPTIPSKPIRTYEWPIGAIHALAFSPDGLTAAAAGDGGDIWVWDIDGH